MVTNTTLENLVERILTYVTRSLSEFNKYSMKFWICWRFCITKPLTATMTKRSTIGSFIIQTARENIDSSKDHFKDLVMHLLGDKDHKKVLDNVCKVKK